MLEWLDGVDNVYEAQDRLAARVAERGVEATAAEVRDALSGPTRGGALSGPTRELALGLASSLAQDVEDVALAAELLSVLAASVDEPADATFAAIARVLVRAPSERALLDAVRVTARRAVQPEYDARHGFDFLERAVREGRTARETLQGFEDAVRHPDAPREDDAIFSRACAVSEPDEEEALLSDVGPEAVASVIVERARELAAGSPEADRIRLLAENVRARLPASPLRGRLALVQAELGLGELQIAFGCLVAALADGAPPSDVLALVTEGFELSPDVVDDDTVDFLVRTHALDASLTDRLRTAIAAGRGESSD